MAPPLPKKKQSNNGNGFSLQQKRAYLSDYFDLEVLWGHQESELQLLDHQLGCFKCVLQLEILLV